jgi:hypothetical protein
VPKCATEVHEKGVKGGFAISFLGRGAARRTAPSISSKCGSWPPLGLTTL